MPKRPVTPELDPEVKGNSKFMAVWNPWPPNARIDAKGIEDTKQFVQWIACITGPDAVLSVYYRPSSPSIVVVEIDGSFRKFPTLVGAHSWQHVFRDTPKENLSNQSKVYYSIFGSDRELHKSGWKILVVEDRWLSSWKPDDNRMVQYPYPASTWCEVPPEDAGGIQFCHNVPRSYFPETDLLDKAKLLAAIPPAPPPVVGTAAWANNRSRGRGRGAPVVRRGGPSTQPAPVPRKFPSQYSTEDAMLAVIGKKPPKQASKAVPTKTSNSDSAASALKALSLENVKALESWENDSDSDEYEGGWGGGAADWGTTTASVVEDDSMSTISAWDGGGGANWADETEKMYTPSTPKRAPQISSLMSEENPFANNVGGSWDEEVPKKQETVIKCPEHGDRCKPKICQFAKSAKEEANNKLGRTDDNDHGEGNNWRSGSRAGVDRDRGRRRGWGKPK